MDIRKHFKKVKDKKNKDVYRFESEQYTYIFKIENFDKLTDEELLDAVIEQAWSEGNDNGHESGYSEGRNSED